MSPITSKWPALASSSRRLRRFTKMKFRNYFSGLRRLVTQDTVTIGSEKSDEVWSVVYRHDG
jgi:hypothetical protein